MEPIFIFVVVLIAMSAICSGLNVSLMALKPADLKRKAKLGDANAKKVVHLRVNSHLSLASILLTNVAVISTTSIVLEHRFNGIVAGIASTLLIVIFGEIFPQAFFLKNALKITAFFSPVLKAMIFITYPIAKPLQLLLDKLFGHEEGKLHSRHELGLIIAEHSGHKESELDDDEIEIIRGALKLSEMHVYEIMTPIESTYYLSIDSIINAQTIDEIKAANYSRIPLLNKAKTEAQGILLMKDLVDIDFDERAYTVSELPVHKLATVGARTALDTMFRKFISAHTHLMAIEKNDVIVGITTIEDLIEEILGHEIEDESDDARAGKH
jgi:metal transporter CNNM